MKRTPILILLAIILLSTSSCQKASLNKNLIGKWQLIENPNSTIEFTSENNYRFYIGDMDIAKSISGEEGWKYTLGEENDSLFVYVTDPDDSLVYKGFPEIHNDILYLTFFEKLLGKENFVKDLGVYRRVRQNTP